MKRPPPLAEPPPTAAPDPSPRLRETERLAVLFEVWADHPIRAPRRYTDLVTARVPGPPARGD